MPAAREPIVQAADRGRWTRVSRSISYTAPAAPREIRESRLPVQTVEGSVQVVRTSLSCDRSR